MKTIYMVKLIRAGAEYINVVKSVKCNTVEEALSFKNSQPETFSGEWQIHVEQEAFVKPTLTLA